MKTTWIVKCAACLHSWTLTGYWSDGEREAMESRPCPKCVSYTLTSPEPTAEARARRPFHSPVVPTCRQAA